MDPTLKLLPKPAAAALVALALLAAVLTAWQAPAAKSGRRVPFASTPRQVFIGPLTGLPEGVNPPRCVTPDGTKLRCYTPALLQQAYNFPTDRNAPTGRGQTIVLVDAFGSPTIREDLARFDDLFGVAPATSFTILGPNGTGDPGDDDVKSWQLETSLDVEYAHAMAPGANIVLVVAKTDDNADFNSAEAAALLRYPGAIVSHSFGSDEGEDVPNDAILHGIFALATRSGDTLVAGAGDFGATNLNERPTAVFPASDPLVTGVGGTEGLPYPKGLLLGHNYGAEQVWNEGDLYGVAGGGAPSSFFRSPWWQRNVSGSPMRTTPDVAYDAAFDGGVLVAIGKGIALVYGTSIGSPQWAAIFALANERRSRTRMGQLGFVNPALYSLARDSRSYRQDFHDITVGNNALDSESVGFPARSGYDLATGLGTPNAANLIEDLAGVPSSQGQQGDDSGDMHGGSSDGREHRRHPIK